MGANIGTTITGQLIALDIGAIAPLIAFIGVALIIFLKSPKVHNYGLIVAGLGVLFLGMEMMSSSMMPLRDSEAFVGLMTKFSNPVLGILAGAVFTAIIQSSSASVGILQALASNGLIGLPSAVSDIQYDRDGDLYDRLYPDAADRSSGKLDANQRGSPDRQYAYII